MAKWFDSSLDRKFNDDTDNDLELSMSMERGQRQEVVQVREPKVVMELFSGVHSLSVLGRCKMRRQRPCVDIVPESRKSSALGTVQKLTFYGDVVCSKKSHDFLPSTPLCCSS